MPCNKDREFPVESFSRTSDNGNDFPLRVLLYSHDSVGLGHLRRNLAIADEVAGAFPNSSVLIVTGSPCATQFELPANTDLIKISSITKNEQGIYVSRSSSSSLESTLKLRSQMILQSFRAFKPDLIIMDHQVTGLKGEAMDMLREAKHKGVSMIYGSRDIKDAPEVVHRNWDNADCRWALNEAYDRICIYGMPDVFDPRVAYVPHLDHARHVDFTGYIVAPLKQAARKTMRRQRKKVLVIFGGGGDGAQRAEMYLQALAEGPVSWDSHIITGPLMDSRMKKNIRKRTNKTQPIGSVRVQRFHRNIPELLRQVDAVVSMAGYNSCAEILQSGVPAVLLPRSFPRKEQLIRAERMAELGWVSYLSEEDPDPVKLYEAIVHALETPHRVRQAVNLNGLSRLCDIILEQMQSAGLIKNVPSLRESRNKAM